MRTRKLTALVAAFLALGLLGCESRTDRTDGGGVLLSISDFDGLPVGVSVSTAVALGGIVSMGEITVSNVPKDPNGVVGDLMNVEIQSYEITFTRGDTGTRVPPKFVRGIFGVAPVGGTLTIEGLPILSLEQLRNVPLSDLSDFGRDTETGGQTILLNFRLRFFGRTLSGDEVESAPAFFTIEFTP